MTYRLKIACSLGAAGKEITEHEYTHLIPTTQKHLFEPLTAETPALVVSVEAPAEVAPEVVTDTAPEVIIPEGTAETPTEESTVAEGGPAIEEPTGEEAPKEEKGKPKKK